MTTGALNLLDYQDDDAFDRHFSPRIKKLSKLHWSPMAVVKKAAEFLAPSPGSRIIDIGSGAGKFCIAAAQHCPESEFHGIEQRESLYLTALRSKVLSGLDNVHFMHGDFTELNLNPYTGIYFFNSFAENLYTFDRIDNTIQHSASLYNYYTSYLYNILEEKPSGTRLASYHVSENDIPICYELIATDFKNNLKLWISR
ncbi:methyltransferase [Pedobacter ginsengisoli]|uniref:Methyltransferase n=1 Tax=Pedobacter ginsengisoli TaxID=363852 RepID=A0A2D1U861_9SPHI|nr:methyltransferase domain-containing protein [Pedobacter ginsengisoli]ATP57786.1 methyltransferase [Pedobacter ginsengisoli]